MSMNSTAINSTPINNEQEAAVMLDCQSLTRTYSEGPQDLTVLDKLNLQVRAGERVAIVGSSGSGKTTLLNLLGGLDRPSEGSVIIAGEPLSGLNEAALGSFRNRYIGFVYQFHHLLAEFTALENAALPLIIRGQSKKAAEKRAMQILERVGMQPRADHKPGELSGGERQRVAIARALVTDPSLVLMDEPRAIWIKLPHRPFWRSWTNWPKRAPAPL